MTTHTPGEEVTRIVRIARPHPTVQGMVSVRLIAVVGADSEMLGEADGDSIIEATAMIMESARARIDALPISSPIQIVDPDPATVLSATGSVAFDLDTEMVERPGSQKPGTSTRLTEYLRQLTILLRLPRLEKQSRLDIADFIEAQIIPEVASKLGAA